MTMKEKRLESAKKRLRTYANLIGLDEYDIYFSKKDRTPGHTPKTLDGIETTKNYISIINKTIEKDILSKVRNPEFVLYRQALTIILIQKGINKYAIAKAFRQTHSNILNNIRNAENYMAVKDPQFMPYYNEIEKIINNF